METRWSVPLFNRFKKSPAVIFSLCKRKVVEMYFLALR